jgi:predicted small secreted protein
MSGPLTSELEIVMVKFFLMLVLLTGFAGLTACNTTHGLGKDMERGGEKIQDVADDAR